MNLKRREVISPTNLKWACKRAEVVADILQQLKTDWMGIRYRPPLLLSPPPVVHVTSDQNSENFQSWEERVRFNEGFFRNPIDWESEALDLYDLSSKYEELNRNRGN